ncbi:MAG: hypothetical protein GF421_13155 [Candidatus Aminicenantes bacterium]|nr:hypothetical protein [Candidatus Aminicenantes bacterium]
MNRGAHKKYTSIVLCFALIVLYLPNLAKAEENKTGNLTGFVFGEDGTIPVEGAVVTLRNVSTGQVYKSPGTDNQGTFKVEQMQTGMYVMGVTSESGNFNADDLVGVREGKTEKISIALKQYEEGSEDTEKGKNGQDRKGEELVGRVIEYEPNSQIAIVEIIEGVELRKEDEIHALKPDEEESESETDFYQIVNVLTLNDEPIKKAKEGQIVAIYMEEDVLPGDLVYLVKRKGIVPIFLIPIGAALVVGAVTLSEPDDEPDDVTQIKK